MKSKIMNLIGRSSFDFSFPYNLIALVTNPYYFVRKNLWKKVKKYSGMLSGKLLDFGCGCKPYQKFFKNVDEYIGLDIDDRGLDHTNHEIDVYYDGEKIPFEDEAFDSIFSSEVYEHVPNLQNILPEINRVLKVGGVLFVTAPLIWNEHGVPYDFQRFTKYGLKNMLEKNGFIIMESDTSTSYLEILFQLWMEYIRRNFYKLSERGIIVLTIQVLLIFPFALIGSIINLMLPKDDSLYGDSVIVCKKISVS